VSKGSNAFVQMQNIDKFLKACRNLFKVMFVVLLLLLLLLLLIVFGASGARVRAV
jgi:hypothetical protein